ncbi:MAG: radical SAM protein [Candidatus Omnitrophica bacterium]|nr:radical SAM protein [Candidatus Omnitrophota bacterium]
MPEKCDKVLLINPPESGRGNYSSSPLGLLYCASMLQRENIPVKVIDGFVDGWDALLKKTLEFQPTIIGISCPTYARSKSLKVAREVKRGLPHSKIILGGPHPTIMGSQLLEKYEFIDMVAIGESEFLIPDLCNGLKASDIPGLGFRRNSQVILNKKRANIEDLDSVPFPALDLIDPRKYFTDDRGFFEGVNLDSEPCAFVTFSRGCVGNCNFCSNKLMWNRWRSRSPKNMADEIESVNKKYGIRHFHFNDDCFSANPTAAADLCSEITKRGLKIYFDIVTRADCITEDLLKKLKQAGCYRASFGIETASPRLLKIMGKPVSMTNAIEAINLTADSGMQADVFIIAGCLGETWESVNETIDFLSKIKPSKVCVGPGMMVFPGTRLYEHAKKEDFISDDFWLSDYNWKIYTRENSRLMLNVYAEAIRRRKKLSGNSFLNIARYHRFLTKEIEYKIKELLADLGLRRKVKTSKYRVAY